MLDRVHLLAANRVVQGNFRGRLPRRKAFPDFQDVRLGKQTPAVGCPRATIVAESLPQNAAGGRSRALPISIRNRQSTPVLDEVVDRSRSTLETPAHECRGQAGGTHPADQLDLAILEPTVGVRLAEHDVVTLLLRHVCHVVQLRSEPKVVGAHARRIIAAMADVGAIQNRAVGQEVGKAMGLPQASVPPHMTIPATVNAARPDPTIAGSVYAGPKLLWGVVPCRHGGKMYIPLRTCASG